GRRGERWSNPSLYSAYWSRTDISINATSKRSCKSSSTRSLPQWRVATGSSYAALVRSRSRTEPHAPAAIPAHKPTYRSKRKLYRASRPARNAGAAQPHADVLKPPPAQPSRPAATYHSPNHPTISAASRSGASSKIHADAPVPGPAAPAQRRCRVRSTTRTRRGAARADQQRHARHLRLVGRGGGGTNRHTLAGVAGGRAGEALMQR